jgi:predicted  nucleic acid-binding Zn-ribbon protein
MQGNLKSTLKKIANTLNNYVDSKDLKYIEEIENQFEAFFNAEVVKLWKYDDKKETLNLIESRNDEDLSLVPSLTKQSIVSKSSVISNHSTSDKYYTPEIDNPLELKVKALMIFPIIKGKRVLGVLRIWRGLKQRKVFTKQDEITLESFLPLLIKMIACEKIEKEEMIALVGKNKENRASSSPTPHVKTKTKDVPSKVDAELAALKKKFDENLDELKSYKEGEATYKIKIGQSQDELKKSKEKYEKLEASSAELSSEVQAYQSQINELRKQLETVQKEHETLSRELKTEKASNSVRSIKELKIEKPLLSEKKFEKLDENIEFILNEVNHVFVKNEYSYMLFEFLVYALNSKKGMGYLEETLKKSKLVPEIIEGYHFNGDLKVCNEKYIIRDLVKNIEDYQEKIFLDTPKLDIVVDKEMPPSLVFDAPKIQNILLHLLLDLYSFAEHSKPINISLSFKDKLLSIDIGGSVYQKNSLFKSVLKQMKLTENEKDRHGLQLSLKLVKRLKGRIESVYEDEYYKFALTIPTQVIKM